MENNTSNLKLKETPEVMTEKEKQDRETTGKRKWWLPWPLISFAIFYTFRNTKIDEEHLFISLFYFLSLVLAPLFYSWIRPKIKIIKYEKLGSFIIGLVVYLVFCFAIGFLGSLGDAIILRTPLASSDSKENNNTISPEWSQYTSVEDNFSILFPTEPDIKRDTKAIPDYNITIDTRLYSSALEDKQIFYVLLAGKYSSDLINEYLPNIKQGLEGGLNAQMEALSGSNTLLDSNYSNFLTHTSLEYKYKNEEGENVAYIKGVMFMVDNRLYNLSVGYNPDLEKDIEYNKFINSFSIIKNNQIINDTMKNSPAEENCSVAVDEYMKKYKQGKEELVGQWYDSSDYKYHFDPIQDKCFILISTYYTPGTTFHTKFTLNLYDLYIHTEIGTYQEYDNRNIFCNIATQDCASRKEYDSLVDQYME